MSQNIHPEEVEKFDKMASHWWDLSGPCEPLHQLNPLRMRYIREHAILPHQQILDVGCGGGILTESLAKAGAIVTGIDASDAAIHVARAHATLENLQIDYHTTLVSPFAHQHPEAFDVVTCLELIEHVPEPETLLRDLAALLKPNGSLFLSTLNRTPKAFLFAIVGAEYVLNKIPKGTHRYDLFIKPSELAAWARRFGLKLRDAQGVRYAFLEKRFEYGSDLSVNYLMHFQKEAT